MKKACFTLGELALILAIFGIAVALGVSSSGCGGGPLGQARERARSINCVNNLKQMSTVSQMYMDAHRNFWPSGGSANDCYIHAFIRANLIPEDAIRNDKSFARCPSTKIVEHAVDEKWWPQIYGTQYASGRAGVFIVDEPPQNDAYMDESKRLPNAEPVPLSKRVMLADMAARPDGPGTALVQTARGIVTAANPDVAFGAPYFAHLVRRPLLNLATFAGNVDTVSVDQHWTDYYYNRLSIRTVLPQRYVDEEGKLLQPKR